MGLDMYLYRMPRYKDATAKDVSAIESYLDWSEEITRVSGSVNMDFKEYSGYDSIPERELIDFYSRKCIPNTYGFIQLMEQVGYWRKANHIHGWFVENIQNNTDDCKWHREVTQNDLIELRNICNKVLKSSKLIPAKVENGYTFDKDGNKVVQYENGYTIEDPSTAEALLPRQEGFFFGGNSYGRWYLDDVKDTIDIITKVLETTDFNTEMIYYRSSW